MTNSISEVKDSKMMFIIGSNTTENHPIIGTYMKRAKKKGAKLVVADPRRIEMAEYADVFLQLKPGTNVQLLNGMINYIIEHDLYDKEYIGGRTEGFEALKEAVKEYKVEKVAEICELKADDIIEAAKLYAMSPVSAIFYAMGITQHSSGTDHVKAVANLSMLCGNVGVENGGVNPLRGQNNVQGACDMGGLPDVYPGYQKVFLPENREKFEKLWKVDNLSEEKGLTIPKIMDGASNGEVKFIYVMGENPMVSDPDLNHIEHALDNVDFMVVQDIFLNETAMKADVVLPAACFAEKEGTFTNSERRVQRVRKAVDPPGEAKSDWLIIDQIMKRLGYDNNFDSETDVMSEINLANPAYGGITYDRIEEDGIQWPCPTIEHEGTKYLHKDKFAKGTGTFFVTDYKEPMEKPDEEFPLILTTGRILYHYHSMTMTGKTEGLNVIVPNSYIEVSPRRAQILDVNDGDMVKVTSRRGEIEVRVKVTDTISDGVVFMPFHFAIGAANRLTNSALDPVTDIPEYKVCAVKIEKL